MIDNAPIGGKRLQAILDTVSGDLAPSETMLSRLTILINALRSRTLGKYDRSTLALDNAIEYALQADLPAKLLYVWVVLALLDYVNDGEQVTW